MQTQIEEKVTEFQPFNLIITFENVEEVKAFKKFLGKLSMNKVEEIMQKDYVNRPLTVHKEIEKIYSELNEYLEKGE